MKKDDFKIEKRNKEFWVRRKKNNYLLRIFKSENKAKEFIHKRVTSIKRESKIINKNFLLKPIYYNIQTYIKGYFLK